jgi:hypothetical protein
MNLLRFFWPYFLILISAVLIMFVLGKSLMGFRGGSQAIGGRTDGDSAGLQPDSF